MFSLYLALHSGPALVFLCLGKLASLGRSQVSAFANILYSGLVGELRLQPGQFLVIFCCDEDAPPIVVRHISCHEPPACMEELEEMYRRAVTVPEGLSLIACPRQAAASILPGGGADSGLVLLIPTPERTATLAEFLRARCTLSEGTRSPEAVRFLSTCELPWATKKKSRANGRRAGRKK